MVGKAILGNGLWISIWIEDVKCGNNLRMTETMVNQPKRKYGRFLSVYVLDWWGSVFFFFFFCRF
jgi:hypothetical protein